MIPSNQVDGLILAGGQSRRMQPNAGQSVDKGLLVLEGVPLVQTVAAYLQPQVETLYISTNRHAERYGRYGHCIPDDPAFGGNAGPLAGVASVMMQARRPWLFVLPVDVTHLPEDLFPRLADAVAQGAPIAYATAGKGAHPLCMLVRCDLCEDLRDYLQEGGRKVLDWHQRHHATAVDYGANDALFRNINTPADWLAAGGSSASIYASQ